MKPKALILAGYGLNCEDETAFAFQRAGAKADIVHINDLVSRPRMLEAYQILAMPGGFSFGDDLGSGKAYANKLRKYMNEQLHNFVQRDTLTIGICNGFQILTNMGLLPGALTFNDTARHIDRWVDVDIQGKSPWLDGISRLILPIAHGEGKYVAQNDELDRLKVQGAIAGRYVTGEICSLQNLPPNPNGATDAIAGVTAYEGRMIGMMPHPERAQFFYQLPHWPLLCEKLRRAGSPIPKEAGGLQIFKNGVQYFL